MSNTVVKYVGEMHEDAYLVVETFGGNESIRLACQGIANEASYQADLAAMQGPEVVALVEALILDAGDCNDGLCWCVTPGHSLWCQRKRAALANWEVIDG